MAKKAATKAEKSHLAWVAEQGCVVCRRPAQVHHITEMGHGRITRDNFLVIGLCLEHHTGRYGIHSLSRVGFAELYDLDVAHRAKMLRATSPHWHGDAD